jgi:hypothetical protein
MSVSVSEAEVRRWLREAEPGQAIQYFRGFLAMSRSECGAMISAPQRQELAKVADWLWRAAMHDRIHLVQYRHGPGDWSYIAIARERLQR